MEASFAGRVALVTGGGRGIGRALALALAGAGADVAVVARTQEELDRTAAAIRQLGRRALGLVADLARRDAPGAVALRTAEALGPVDLLVNNAGIDASAPVGRTDPETWDDLMAVNATAPFLLIRACLPSMYLRGFGRILNVASVAGLTGLKYGAAYAASKHALVGLTRSVAAECGRKGVTCNALCPSWTESRMMDEALAAISRATGRDLAESRQAVLRSNPLGRAATPEEVAAAGLAVMANAAIHGQCIQVDGGELMA
ncbi:MAG TPA: SDR family NAD(P)-dependent oxidoreductase [Anaeromyxobacteraceae bacterium]|nr:SDR family NAD(P)-dependent oxidoreductase [Anaeromyxobacteraceae bacterium]